ncbi:TRAF-like family protein [Raphanus sativus]|nr:TRAF-like family protein [Raphanus sativus]
MWNQKPDFRFEIENFSKKKDAISSKTFVSGGCEWYLRIYPTGDDRLSDDHLSLFLYAANPTMLPTGWKRSVYFYFVLLNQSDKELHTTPVAPSSKQFCANTPSWGFLKTLPVRKFQEKGFLEKDVLIIEVYIKVVEAFDGEGGDVSVNKKMKKTVDINGFQVFASQVTKVGKIFTEHPDIARDFKPTKQEVKTAYMNVLLRVIKTLNKPPKSLSETRLSKASSELSELMDVGFKLDWLKSKLEEVTLERKKTDADGSRAQQLEELVKHLALKLDEVTLGRKIWDDDNEYRAQQVEERVKNLELKLDEVSIKRIFSDEANEYRAQEVDERVKKLELMEVGWKLDSLNIKLGEVSLERKKTDDKRVNTLARMELRLNTMLGDLERKQTYDTSVFDSRIEQMEKQLESLITKLEEISKEKKKADDADGSLVKQLQESVKNIELMVSHLRVEVDKKKNKSSADDGFLLVD